MIMDELSPKAQQVYARYAEMLEGFGVPKYLFMAKYTDAMVAADTIAMQAPIFFGQDKPRAGAIHEQAVMSALLALSQESGAGDDDTPARATTFLDSRMRCESEAQVGKLLEGQHALIEALTTSIKSSPKEVREALILWGTRSMFACRLADAMLDRKVPAIIQQCMIQTNPKITALFRGDGNDKLKELPIKQAKQNLVAIHCTDVSDYAATNNAAQFEQAMADAIDKAIGIQPSGRSAAR
jgi:hypothetical protein